MSLINTAVKPFKAHGYQNGKFIEVSEQTLKGQWSALVFMPAAFTFNCPTEVEDLANHYAEFQKREVAVYVITTDTHFAHKVWHETSPAVGKSKFALIGDSGERDPEAYGRLAQKFPRQIDRVFIRDVTNQEIGRAHV